MLIFAAFAFTFVFMFMVYAIKNAYTERYKLINTVWFMAFLLIFIDWVYDVWSMV